VWLVAVPNGAINTKNVHRTNFLWVIPTARASFYDEMMVAPGFGESLA